MRASGYLKGKHIVSAELEIQYNFKQLQVFSLNCILYKFGQALFKLGEINEDEDSVAAYDSLRARNRSGSPAKSISDKYHGLSYWQFFRRPEPSHPAKTYRRLGTPHGTYRYSDRYPTGVPQSIRPPPCQLQEMEAFC